MIDADPMNPTAHLCPVGTYDEAELLDHDLGEYSTGTPYAWVKFHVTDHNGRQHEVEGRLVLMNKKGELVSQTLEKLRNCGWDGESFDSLSDKSLVGAVCQVQVEHDQNPNSGTWYANVGWINQNHAVGYRGQVSPENMNRLRTLLAAAPKPVAADDDVPF
jgi:RNase P/RNase MRP subunit p29